MKNKDFWDKVAELEELAEKATQGEWHCDISGYVFRKPQEPSENDKMPIVLLCGSVSQFEKSRFDGKFIAAANPAMIKEMVAEMRRLEKEADRLAEQACQCSEARSQAGFCSYMNDGCTVCLANRNMPRAQYFRTVARKAVEENADG